MPRRRARRCSSTAGESFASRENEAYLRITVARAARENPVLLEMLRDGRLHLSGIARLAPHLTRESSQAVLKRACGMSHREIRELVSELEPRPDVAPTVRKLPERPAPRGGRPLQLGAPGVEPDAVNLVSRMAAPARPPVVEPLAPTRYPVRFTSSAELREKLERLQALMRSSVPAPRRGSTGPRTRATSPSLRREPGGHASLTEDGRAPPPLARALGPRPRGGRHRGHRRGRGPVRLPLRPQPARRAWSRAGGRRSRDLRDVAAAFRTGSITTTFRGDATSVTGTTRLQFAEVLRQDEVFERRDAAAVLWGSVLRCPTWWSRRASRSPTPTSSTSTRSGTSGSKPGVVYVTVPKVEWNRPRPTSALRFLVARGSRCRATSRSRSSACAPR